MTQTNWNGPDALRPLLRDVASLHIDPTNVRVHGADSIQAIKASLTRFGQQKPVVVDTHGTVRAGNGTLQAARELGWVHLACVVTDLAGADAAAFAIMDNRTSEKSEWDWRGLSVALQGLSDVGNLDDTGFSQADLDKLMAAWDTGGGTPEQKPEKNDPNQHWEGMPGIEHIVRLHRKIVVLFASPEDVEEFKRRLALDKITEKTKSTWFPHREREDRTIEEHVVDGD